MIIQSDLYAAHASLTVLPLSSTLVERNPVRIDIDPTAENGLFEPSHIMVDKIQTVPIEKVSRVMGHVTPDQMLEIEASLSLFLGFA